MSDEVGNILFYGGLGAALAFLFVLLMQYREGRQAQHREQLASEVRYALQKTYEITFISVEPDRKRAYVTVDVGGLSLRIEFRLDQVGDAWTLFLVKPGGTSLEEWIPLSAERFHWLMRNFEDPSREALRRFFAVTA